MLTLQLTLSNKFQSLTFSPLSYTEWKIAGETFQPGDDIVIAAVDATASSSLASKYEIKGYPTIKFFPKGSTTPEDYNGGRTADTIVKWVNEKVGTSRKVKTAPSFVTTLTAANFDTALGSKAALVEFYAPWCGHCKQLAPKYEKLAQVFAGEKDVLIAKVDATEEGDLAKRYDVQGYPTIKFFPAGSSEPVNYEKGREVEDMVNFINENAGTQRLPTGGLLPSAGRVAGLDEIIAAAAKIDEALVAALTTASEVLTGMDKGYAKTYVAVAQKVISKGAGYIEKEVKRLNAMINSESVVPASKTNFQLKVNVLNAFIKDA